MSCRLQQCSSSFERKAGGGKGALQTLNAHLTHLQLAALSFSSAVKKKPHKKHQTSTTKGMQKLFLYRLHFPKALSSQRCGQEELQGTSCWENTRKNSHWESAMLSCFQKKRKDLQDMHLTQVWMGKPIGSRSSGISSFTLGLQTGTQVCRNKTEKR